MKHLFLLFAIFNILVSCHKDELTTYKDKDVASGEGLSLEQQMNEFIEGKMKDIYLWADSVKDRDINTNQDPSDFLAAMRCKTMDIWSYLEVAEGDTKANIDGYETTFGYQIQFYRKIFQEDLNRLVGMILYVYPKTPAARAGLKRGDMIVMNNGEYLYKDNIAKVINDSRVSLKMGVISDGDLNVFPKEYKLSAQKVALNPILLDTILEVEDKKVGYLVYSQFIDNESNSLSDLSEAIGDMKTESIDEFILDLRYNSGGRVSAAVRLASLLAPADAVANKDILIYKQWNETYQREYQSTSAYTENCFAKSVLGDNLDLDKIYILTGERTASASELVISGLCPYISDVILIGEKTHGKYTGMTRQLPKEELQKWTLWPVTFSYTNVNGEDVKGGIYPRYTIREYDDYLPPFGSSEDLLLAKAIELISGQAQVASLQTRSQRASDSWIPLEDNNKYLLLDK